MNLVRFEMEFDVDCLILRIHCFEGVGAVTVHMPEKTNEGLTPILLGK
jgi:hypothetical protein